MADILSGTIIRDEHIHILKNKIDNLVVKPTLAIIQVGNNSESLAYIRQKKIFAENIGAIVIHKQLDEKITEKEVLALIKSYNLDKDTHGIIIQIPLPLHLDKQILIDAIDPKKDIDGLTSINSGRLWNENPKAVVQSQIPATARGILMLLDYYNIPIKGQKITIIGKSLLVGKPIALLLMNRNATVTICHKETKNLKEHTTSADILIVAAGQPKLITKDHVSSGQVIIDVGITTHINSDGKRILYGDANFTEVEPIVAKITPVPGGVGPLTVTSLFENLLDAYDASTVLLK